MMGSQLIDVGISVYQSAMFLSNGLCDLLPNKKAQSGCFELLQDFTS